MLHNARLGNNAAFNFYSLLTVYIYPTWMRLSIFINIYISSKLRDKK